MDNKEAKELAESHWEFVGGLLKRAGIGESGLLEYLFITALMHGIKHGQEVVSSKS